MTIDAGDTLRTAVDDLASTRGAVLYVAFAVFSLVSLPIHNTLTRELFDLAVEVAGVSPDQIALPATPLALDVSIPVLVAALAVIFVVAELLRILAIRSFASEASDVIPMEEVTAGGAATLLVLLAASLIVQALVYGGMVMLIIPGLIFAVLTLFVRQAILLGDAGVVDSITESGSIVVEETVPVIALLVVLMVLSVVAGFPSVVFAPDTIASLVTGIVFGTLTTVYGVAVFTRAYQQAGDEEGDDDSVETNNEIDEPLGVDDIDDGAFEEEDESK